jgi:predicted aspartyl protease
MLTAAAPAAAAECGPLTVVTSMAMTPVGGSRNVMTVPATIADRRAVKLLLDTGAAFSMINRNVVEELQLPTEPARIRLVDLAGHETSREVRLPSITLGRVSQEGVYLIVNPNANPLGGNPVPFDGVLGADIFRNFDLDLDFGGRKVNLISPDHCEGKVEYWSAPRLAIVPMHLNSKGQVMIPVTLDGHRLTAMLDTGATMTAISAEIAADVFNIDTHGPEVERVGALKGPDAAPIYRHRFTTLAIEGVTVADLPIDLLPDVAKSALEYQPAGSLIRRTDDPFPDMLLGMSVLNQLHVYVAYKESRIYITQSTPSEPAAPPAPQP